MKYLFINVVAGIGSTGRIAAEKCRELQAQGHECVLAYGRAENGCEGIRIIPAPYPAMQMVMPVGGFLVLGCVIAASQWLVKHLEMKNKKKEAAK